MSIIECRMGFLTDCQRIKRTIEAFTTLEQTEHDSFSFLPLEHSLCKQVLHSSTRHCLVCL